MEKNTQLSASKINSFKTCRLQYYAGYILGMRGPTHPSAKLGSAIHKILEDLVKNKKLPDIRKTCDEFEVDDHDFPLVKSLLKKTLNNGYLTDVKYNIGVEHRFKHHVSDDLVISGSIDRLDIKDNVAIIIDLKTGKHPFTSKELKNNYQSKIYNIAITKEFPDIAEIHVIFWFLKTQERQIVTISKEQTTKDIDDILNINKDICAMEIPPAPTKNKYCMYCVYMDKCPIFRKEITLKPSF